MKKTFLVELSFDDKEFDLNRITHEFVQEVLENFIGGRGVDIRVINKEIADIDEKTRVAEIAAALYGNELPDEDFEYIKSCLYPFEKWYEEGKQYEHELKQEYGDLEYDELVTKDLNEQIRKGVIMIIVYNGKIWVFIP